MSEVQLNEEHIERFATRLKQSPRRRIDNDFLWRSFHAAFPNRPAAMERIWFLAALELLERRGVIVLPSSRGGRWDRALTPHVPMSVDLPPAEVPHREETWRKYPWHADLRWVRELHTLTQEEQSFLLRVHAGLVAGSFREIAPIKYRSLQLTGHEKRLGALVLQRLFTPGRLTLEHLGTEPDHPPMAIADITSAGRTGRLLIVENAGTFQTVRRVLKTATTAPYDAIAFGDGTRVLASIRDLIERPPVNIAYVGDIDSAGLFILKALDQAARESKLPPVVPATGIHVAMLEAAAAFGRLDGWPNDAKSMRTHTPEDLSDVLPPEARARVASLLRANRRIPEEVLGPAELRALWA